MTGEVVPGGWPIRFRYQASDCELRAASCSAAGLQTWWVSLIAGLGISVWGRDHGINHGINPDEASFVLFCQDDEDEKRAMCGMCRLRPFVYLRVSHHQRPFKAE